METSTATTTMRSFAPPDRKYIQCDAADCGAASPMMRCSHCLSVYYCSKTCQRNDWPEHKHKCAIMHKQHNEAKSSHLSSLCDTEHTKMLQKKDGMVQVLCGVCLEDKITSPYALKSCRHVFCHPCLQSYYTAWKRMEQPLKCPLCRPETEDVDESRWTAAYFHYRQAKREPEPSAKRGHLIHMALGNLDLISNENPDLYIEALLNKVEALQLIGNYRIALDIIGEVLELDKKGKISTRTWFRKFGILVRSDDGYDNDDYDDSKLNHPMALQLIMGLKPMEHKQEDVHIDILLLKAEVYEKFQNWVEAFCVYRAVFKILRSQSNTKPSQQLFMLAGTCRCLYHMRKFDDAIQTGLKAIHIFRPYAGVRKYMALSYKEKGDLEKAKELMSQAVFYETPWDERKIYQARLLLGELNNINE